VSQGERTLLGQRREGRRSCQDIGFFRKILGKIFDHAARERLRASEHAVCAFSQAARGDIPQPLGQGIFGIWAQITR
jgi:hypothetical protein